ncbi:MAG: GtrA family protein, partial [Pontimonas sp.]
MVKTSGLPQRKRGSGWLYGLIGLTGVALDFLVFWVLIEIDVIPVLATVVSSVLGMANNYLWNARVNFRTPLSTGALIRYVTVGVGGLIAS